METQDDIEHSNNELGWVLISPEILAATDICMGEKVVCGRVTGLIGKTGYCYASNEWLGKQMGFSDRTIGKYISELVEKGYLRREYGPNGKRDRRLFPITPRVAMEIPITPIGASHNAPRSNPLLPEELSLIESVELSVEGSKEPPSDNPKMSKDDLNLLTEKYAELQGARPRGKSWLPIQQGMKQMVVEEAYTVEQVTGCMVRLKDLGWTWTINTIRKWIANYAAGAMPDNYSAGLKSGSRGETHDRDASVYVNAFNKEA